MSAMTSTKENGGTTVPPSYTLHESLRLQRYYKIIKYTNFCTKNITKGTY